MLTSRGLPKGTHLVFSIYCSLVTSLVLSPWDSDVFFLLKLSIALSNIALDWLQSLKQFFINVSNHIPVASLTLMALFHKTEPSELDWLQVYDLTHWWKIVLRTGASLTLPWHVYEHDEALILWFREFETPRLSLVLSCFKASALYCLR